jgi:5,10-methylenetetrahydromethanopterin reductase
VTGYARIPALGLCVDRTLPPPVVVEVARRLDRAGADQIWVVEDCFYTAGVSLAAAALTATDQLTVGIGIMPAVARNPAITAMEIATLAGLAPRRLLPGIGHGIQDWMAQMGARATSPLTALTEVLTAVRRLLRGERVTMNGRHVHLDDVALDSPPSPVPPVLAGVRGPKSLAAAGRASDGLILPDGYGPAAVRAALSAAVSPESPDPFHIVVLTACCVARDRTTAYQQMAPWLADQIDGDLASVRDHPHREDLLARYRDGGADGLVDLPPEWWTELGAIGTLDDARAHLEALTEVGVHSVGLLAGPDPDTTMARIDVVDRLRR